MQVVCPRIVRTEFHSRQGMDMGPVPRMEPDDVVTASLRGLEQGEVVCLPGAPDDSTFKRLRIMEIELMSATAVTELAARYAQG